MLETRSGYERRAPAPSIDSGPLNPYAPSLVRLRAVVAFIAVVALSSVTILHSAFACTTAAHLRSAEHGGRAGHHGCKETGTPPCCQEPANTVAVQKIGRPADDLRLLASSMLSGPLPARLVSGVTTLHHCRILTPVAASAASPRTHLLLRTLLL
jgi:hypothetical protein